LQWCIELADMVLRLEPDHPQAKMAKAKALDEMSPGSQNLNIGNYYMTDAAELRGDFEVKDVLTNLSPEYIETIPLQVVFDNFAVRLDWENTVDLEIAAGFRLPDRDEEWSLQIRRGGCKVLHEIPDDPEFVLIMDAQIFKEMIVGIRNRPMTLMSHTSIDPGTVLDVKSFFDYFIRPDE